MATLLDSWEGTIYEGTVADPQIVVAGIKEAKR